MKKVVVGLSGGVDSSVAAYLLKEQGYDVIGVFMRNWNEAEYTLETECPWIEDSQDALLVAEKLGIPFQVIDFSEEYKTRIVDYMFSEYKNGRTPNPDILCNREVKFDLFLETALSLGADYVATGHYVQKETTLIEGKDVHRLLAGEDNNKDQSYFLCQLNQYQLSKAIFPIGGLQKPRVREIALEQGLATAQKKDSQGLCFIGKVSLPDFLQQKLQPKKGEVIEIPKEYTQDNIEYSTNLENRLIEQSNRVSFTKEDGKVVGTHQGAHYYTIGQRKGLGIGGYVEPLFVLQTDVDSNIIYVGEGASHEALFSSVVKMNNSEVHWLREDFKPNQGVGLDVMVRIRYRQALKKATVYIFEKYTFIELEEPLSAVTPGQFAAWYIDNELIGSGVIS